MIYFIIRQVHANLFTISKFTVHEPVLERLCIITKSGSSDWRVFSPA